MKHKSQRLLGVLTLLTFVLTGYLIAGIIATSGGVVVVSPPASVEQQVFESNTEIRIFVEQQELQLNSTLAVDISQPGLYDSESSLTSATLAAGIEFNAYFVHVDPEGGAQDPRPFDGSVTFDEPIFGLIVLDQTLDDTDPILGLAGTAYATGSQLHGLDFFPQDAVTISDDRRTLTLNLKAGGMVDQLRVITLSNYVPPEANFEAEIISSGGNSLLAFVDAGMQGQIVGEVPVTVEIQDQTRVGTSEIDTWNFLLKYTDSKSDSAHVAEYFEPNPTHTLEKAGPVTVSLTVTDVLGVSDTETKEDFILVIDPHAANSSANGEGQNANDADPVNLFNGELFTEEPADIDLGGPLPLLFKRYYAAFLTSDSFVAGVLGNNWLHNFDWRLTQISETFVRIISDRGRVILFEKVDSEWQLRGNRNIPFQLVQSNSDFIFADPRSKRLLTFDSAGNLLAIADGKDNTHALSYTAEQLTAVTDGLGRTLTFDYDGNERLMRVSDGARTLEFGYSGDNLTSFTDAEGNVTNYGYTASNSVAGLLTAKTLPAGNAPFSQTYDDGGRVASQTDANANMFTFTYNETGTSGVSGLRRLGCRRPR